AVPGCVAIGPEAGRALDGFGWPGARIRGACREALHEHARELAGPLLLVTGSAGRESLRGELVALGATVVEVVAYRTVARMPALAQGARAPVIDAVVLASSSCARAVLGGPLGDALR